MIDCTNVFGAALQRHGSKAESRTVRTYIIVSVCEFFSEICTSPSALHCTLGTWTVGKLRTCRPTSASIFHAGTCKDRRLEGRYWEVESGNTNAFAYTRAPLSFSTLFNSALKTP